MLRALFALAVLSACSATAVAPPSRFAPIVIDDGETLGRWGRDVRLTDDAADGGHAVVVDLTSGANFTYLLHGEAGVDLSDAQQLTFSWKVEGNGLTGFLVKVRNYPLAGGMEAVYEAWKPSMGEAAGEWTRVSLPLAKPTWDDWGETPSRERRYIAFRTQVADGATPRLYLDSVMAVPAVFDWELGRPRERDGEMYAPVTLWNLTSDPISVTMGPRAEVWDGQRIEPDGVVQRELELRGAASTVAQLAPLQRWQRKLYARVAPAPETTLEATVSIVKPLDLPAHPRLLLNADGVRALNDRAAKHDWARRRLDGVLSYADGVLNDDIVLPPRGSNWWHWYASPKSGATLRTGKQIGDWEWEHVDPVNGDVYLGDPTDPSRDFDGIVLAQKHGGWATAVERLGVAFQITGDDKYATKAREILLAYADRYLDYPLHTTRNEPKIGGGRVGPQTLDESTWLIRMAQGADLIWDSLSDDDRATLADKLFLPAARDVILPHKMGVHNIQCWKNSAVGLVGFLLGDADLIWEAIENPDSGYRKQMAEGVAPDGAWWEGAWSYHFYTMSSLWPLTEAARNCGIDLYGDALRGMFDAPIRFAMPDLTLPAFNDSGAVDLAGRASMYELGYARYGAPEYVDLLAEGGRNSDFALWFGEDVASDAAGREWRSVNHPESGYAILARGEGPDATWLCLKYGPHGGGHGHPDKLNFVLYARGHQIAIDPGTARYGQPIQSSWYRTTLAHNTLIVDGESQQTATGKLLAFGSAGDVDYVTAEAGDIYDGVRFTRTVALLNEDLIVFVDRVEADRERMFDIAYHQLGRWTDVPDAEPWEDAEAPGYRHMRDGRARNAEGVTLRGEVADGLAVAITLASNEETVVITGTGVGNHLEDRVPMAVFRRSAQRTDFAWAVSVAGEPVDVAWDGELLSVGDHTGARWKVRIDADGTLARE
ncbi:hypothetical protein CMK11_14165 [Candidatus Poribacteria bacterium]|nr:hypothetical protein [Candidatus Poribacteria bacterium]